MTKEQRRPQDYKQWHDGWTRVLSAVVFAWHRDHPSSRATNERIVAVFLDGLSQFGGVVRVDGEPGMGPAYVLPALSVDSVDEFVKHILAEKD